MTDKTTKLRSVFLAFVMVTSVFAGTIAFTGALAGTAAAASTPGSTSYQGGAVHYDDPNDENGDVIVEVPLNESISADSQTIANFTLLDDDNNVSKDGWTVTQDGDSNAIIIDTKGDVIRSNDLEVDITAPEVVNGGEKSVVFASQSVATDTSVDDFSAFKGSTVAVRASTGDSVEVEGPDNFFTSGSVGDNSEVYVFDTSNRDLGDYEFTVSDDSGSTYDAEFNVTVRDLGLEVDLDDLTVTDEDAIEGTVSANRGGSQVDLSLQDSDEDEVANDTVTLNGQGEADIDFASQETGNYTIVATDLNTGVEVESSSIEVSDAGEGSADIGGEGIVTDQRGDIANITIEIENADFATVTLGSDDVGFESNVTVEDVDGDGQVNLLFNTYAAINAQGDVTNGDVYDVPSQDEGDDDSIENATIEQSVGSLLDAGEYDLEVRSGEKKTADSQGVGTLVLEERTTDGIVSWTAPNSLESDLEDKDDVYEAIGNNNITQDNNVAYGDLAVHQLQASGLEGALVENDSDMTNAFLALNGGAYKLTVEQTNPGANRDAYTLELGADNTTVVADADNDTYFVVLDTDEVSADLRSVENDDSLMANFTVMADEGNLTVDDEQQTVEDEYSLVEAEHDVDEPVNVSASSAQTISGETTIAPGTELSLRVRSSGDTQPSFLKTATAYVTENNTFSATFDFTEQEAGDTFDFRVTDSSSRADSLTVEGNVLESVETETEMTETDAPDTATDAPDTATDAPDTATDAPDTATDAPDTATEEPADDTETSTGTPGFGAVVAVTALLAAALLAVRRD
ncbi:BGTF surface domain-containing protein [Halogeometricum sp. CBA1124]|uniref:DUF7827 domain-containing protein n=1 Tax=Halogeometricum sp. CBA1124 TaxID=2668071 RepID=UPI00142A1482|nr:BGTF surface domain-containing protein [Halogeometricum sp. CBA1124]MUV57873.1 PGF-CTERM sorting domain-containing protein [Halogeometricum sp. CBA1124]